jgi:hypothetical protein
MSRALARLMTSEFATRSRAIADVARAEDGFAFAARRVEEFGRRKKCQTETVGDHSRAADSTYE